MAKTVYDDTSEVIGIAAALGTGAIAFSVGLLAAPVSVPLWARWLLVLALIALSAVIVCVVVLRGAIIYRKATGTGKLDDLRNTFILGFSLLILGCVAVLIALVATMLEAPAMSAYRVSSALEALRVGRLQTEHKPCRIYYRVTTIELIHGLDSSGPRDATWHVHFDLRDPQRDVTKCPAAYDVYIDAKTGSATSL